MADLFQPKFVDLVRNYTSTMGTGNLVLGETPPGFTSFGSALKAGDQFYYSVMRLDTTSESEVGRGTLQADGSIARDPMGGVLTNFTSGSKSVALVAAAEWFQSIDAGSAATFAAADSRAALAGVANRTKPAMLLEPGREGLFVFDASDRSTEVTADTAQGIHVAPASDPSGKSGAWVRRYSGAIEASWFGATGDGATDDSAAIQAALTHFESTGGGELRFGPRTYAVSGTLLLFASDVTIDARGATLTTADVWATPMFYVGGDRARIIGGIWKVTVAGARQFDVEGRDCTLDGCTILHDPIADTTQLYVRYGADGFQMINCRLDGATDGITIESSNVLITGNSFGGYAPGAGDDAIAIKAIQGTTQNIRILGNRFENHAFFCSIGSQIGMQGANDPTYSRQVRDIIMIGNTGEACAGMLYIKPGAITPYDYRDGVVEAIVVSDNTLYDLNGIKLNRAITITPARGAKVRNITGKNNIVIGRALNDGSSRYIGLDLFNIDQSAASPGCNAPSISDVDVGMTVIDPFDGAASGGSAPGMPFNYAAQISNQTTSHGTMSNIVIDLRANGTWLSGIVIGAGLDDAVFIRRARLSNINVNGSNSYGGIQYLSRISVGQDISISTIGGTPYKPAAGTSAEIVSHVDHVSLGGIGAGAGGFRFPWAAPENAYVTKIEMLSSTAIIQSTDDTNYTLMDIRNTGKSGNAIATVSSKLTGGQSFPAAMFNTLLDARNVNASMLQADLHFGRGNLLKWSKSNFGTGNAVTDAYLRVHWAPF